MPSDDRGSSLTRVSPDDQSAQWVATLSSGGAQREQAVDALHALLLRIARAEVGRHSGHLHLAGVEVDDIAHEAAADAMLALMAKLHLFRGESRFTTWAYRFVILEVSNKVGRHFWRRPSVPMQTHDWDQLPDRLGVGPAEQAQWGELAAAVRRAVEHDLTERQREVFVAIVVDGIPVDALVARLGSSRNAVYKVMFDARRKVRDVLVANGQLDEPGPAPGRPARVAHDERHP
ncbi:MAG: sigma-70 family RNA polymerase sigma factor [Lapillicoccus sp.]